MFFKKQKLLIFIFLLATLVVASLAWADDETDSALITCPDGVTKAINWTECSEEDVAKIKSEQEAEKIPDYKIRNINPNTEIVTTDSGRAVRGADGEFLYLDDMTDEQRARLGIIDDPDFSKVRLTDREIEAKCSNASNRIKCMNELEQKENKDQKTESNYAKHEREQRELRQQAENQAPPPSSPPKEDKNKNQKGLCEALRKAESTTGLTTITGNFFYSKCL